MKISFTKYPVDIIICILWSLILLPIALSDLQGAIRIILGVPFLIFIPGYTLIFALFPTKKTDKGIDTIERIAFSFGLSIAIVTLTGLFLNYTQWGIRLEPIIISLSVFIIAVGSLAFYRWNTIDYYERFTISFDIPLPKYENKIDKILTYFLVISIIIAAVSFIYIAITPTASEKYSEFYILDSEGIAGKYPRYLHIGEKAEGNIGIVNHEYMIMNYTIDIWFINQTIIYNETQQKNYTIINNMWFQDKITTSLKYISGDLGQPWTPQWEHPFSFNMDKKGFFKLAFLLHKTPTEKYEINKDYKNDAEEIINSAFETTYLWIGISDLPKISNIKATPPLVPPDDFVNISCEVFDADGIDSVHLIIRDPDGYFQNFPITENRTSDTSYYSNKTYNISGKYDYYIWANDTTGKGSTSTVSHFTVTDVPIIPDIWTSPPSTYQGGYLNISCLIFDLDDVKDVFLNISYPDGEVQNFSITGNRTGLIYYCNQTYLVAGDYSFFIWVNDTYGNSNTSSIKEFSVTVFPVIYKVKAIPPLAPQGGFVNISCTAFDIDGISEVFLNIKYPDDNTKNFSIIHNKTGYTYHNNQTYMVPGDYSYFIWAKDSTGKTNTSKVSHFSVTDLPYIIDIISTPSSTLQDDYINISCKIIDIDKIDSVFLNIQDPDGNVQNFSITNNKTGDIYYCNKTYKIPGRYYYLIWANDTTNKSSTSTVSQFIIMDLPNIYDVLATPTSTLQDGFVNISCNVSDNDGINEVYLYIEYPDGNEHNFSIIHNKTGYTYYYNQNYTITGDYIFLIWVKDIYGNIRMSDIEKFIVTI